MEPGKPRGGSGLHCWRLLAWGKSARLRARGYRDLHHGPGNPRGGIGLRISWQHLHGLSGLRAPAAAAHHPGFFGFSLTRSQAAARRSKSAPTSRKLGGRNFMAEILPL
ncbi:hypothetical protein PVAP13_J321901 [Panicum virgatum]|nr:hypothetical protein PVAP13_J321901 [Panicum virgatum]